MTGEWRAAASAAAPRIDAFLAHDREVLRPAEWPPHPVEIEYVRDEPTVPPATSQG